MADIELVIKLDEEVYKHILSMQFCIPGLRSGKSLLEKILKAIRTGTPLPKGHGRLIDADSLKSIYSINRANFNTVVGIQKWIDDAPTIIEADKEEE